MAHDERVEKIAADSSWSEETAEVCLQAHFRCEYCGLDFLASPDNYKQIQVDHIVPKHLGGPDEKSNYAASCRTCNVSWKSRWDPRTAAGNTDDRDALVAACIEYIRRQRRKLDAELSRLNGILYPDRD